MSKEYTLNKNSWPYNLYKETYDCEPPSQFCDYFNKILIILLLLPITCFTYSAFGFVQRYMHLYTRFWNAIWAYWLCFILFILGGWLNHKLDLPLFFQFFPLISILILFLIIAILVIIFNYVIEFFKFILEKTENIHIYSIINKITKNNNFMRKLIVKRNKKEKSSFISLFVIKYKSWKDKYCPVIHWVDEEK